MVTEIINRWGLPQIVESSDTGLRPVEVLEERVCRSSFERFQNEGFLEKFEPVVEREAVGA